MRRAQGAEAMTYTTMAEWTTLAGPGIPLAHTQTGSRCESCGGPIDQMVLHRVSATAWISTFSTTLQPVYLAQIDESFHGTSRLFAI